MRKQAREWTDKERKQLIYTALPLFGGGAGYMIAKYLVGIKSTGGLIASTGLGAAAGLAGAGVIDAIGNPPRKDAPKPLISPVPPPGESGPPARAITAISAPAAPPATPSAPTAPITAAPAAPAPQAPQQPAAPREFTEDAKAREEEKLKDLDARIARYSLPASVVSTPEGMALLPATAVAGAAGRSAGQALADTMARNEKVQQARIVLEQRLDAHAKNTAALRIVPESELTAARQAVAQTTQDITDVNDELARLRRLRAPPADINALLNERDRLVNTDMPTYEREARRLEARLAQIDAVQASKAPVMPDVPYERATGVRPQLFRWAGTLSGATLPFMLVSHLVDKYRIPEELRRAGVAPEQYEAWQRLKNPNP